MNNEAIREDFIQRTMAAVYAYEKNRPEARFNRHPTMVDFLLKAGTAGGIGLGMISTARLFAMALAPPIVG